MSKEIVAWENAIIINNKNKNQFRLCYICKTEMNHGTKWNSDLNQHNGWNIDHIDVNESNDISKNLCAVHYECNWKKGNKDYTQLYKDAKNLNWTIE
ncbi:hypothetical protein [Spiroplasma turonicum]|uniref:HNH nuclease domain-containing protein n=1 Tax=Spiroplasma turonicum TaxID=216946 RepID=A0A0K1P6Q9_9MOLU|nr:hypothetical protein [Spiroplasma turonicum]AKU79904.1 hypothetical protein STURON_00658 [Spiroplasma turonicum]ALX70915.1 hypothetical protein STURO_v1c06560 [Spiroplasma turonicum]